ncbi:phosphatase PAP2 family protein [Halomarina pelagica]|uniref:phosphatase PAP2 family protein n=1 Tax=Halomarina pelagica TaxID=2961599 RepID=UPI0020C40FCE|nr:phosphatase PAP2 family protein [Halomarina sp. BND7]
MVPLPPETLFVGGVFLASALALAVGTAVFLPDRTLRSLAREFLSTDWKYIGVAWAVTYAVNEVARRFHADRMFTESVYEVEGTAVAVFQTVTSPRLTLFFTGAYLVGFPFVVLFTYFKLKAHDEQEAHRYALAYVALVLLAVPFFLLFPVRIPSLYVAEVRPLMLDVSPVVRAGIFATDTLVKAFPSLHTGLSVLAALYARSVGGRYARFAAVLAFVVVLSTLYLGVHWLTDALFATMLVAPAYYLSRRVDPDRVLRLPARR